MNPWYAYLAQRFCLCHDYSLMFLPMAMAAVKSEALQRTKNRLVANVLNIVKVYFKCISIETYLMQLFPHSYSTLWLHFSILIDVFMVMVYGYNIYFVVWGDPSNDDITIFVVRVKINGRVSKNNCPWKLANHAFFRSSKLKK